MLLPLVPLPPLPLPPLHSPSAASTTPWQRASQAFGNCRCVVAWHTGRNSRVQVHDAAAAAQHGIKSLPDSSGRGST